MAGKVNTFTNYPASLDTFDAGLYDPAIALAVNELETVVGVTGSYNFLPAAAGGAVEGTQLVSTGAITSATATTALGSISLGSALQNLTGYDVLLVVFVAVTANTSFVLKVGTGTTNAPTQATIDTGNTLTGVITVPIYIQNNQYALLSQSGTDTAAITGQIAFAI